MLPFADCVTSSVGPPAGSSEPYGSGWAARRGCEGLGLADADEQPACRYLQRLCGASGHRMNLAPYMIGDRLIEADGTVGCEVRYRCRDLGVP